jgi:hypothetical protein
MAEPVAKLSWSPPRLIVLARGAPEESVLMSCKLSGASGADAANGGCFATNCQANCRNPAATS